MGIFEWCDDYSIGIMAIDIQHKKIIELVDELVQAIRDSREDCIIDEVLDDLVDYANYHFSLEERLLHRYGFADEHDHETQHREFIEMIRSLKVKENVRANNVPRETLDYLENWFCAHELKSDAKYGSYLRAKGLAGEVEERIRKGEL